MLHHSLLLGHNIFRSILSIISFLLFVIKLSYSWENVPPRGVKIVGNFVRILEVSKKLSQPFSLFILPEVPKMLLVFKCNVKIWRVQDSSNKKKMYERLTLTTRKRCITEIYLYYRSGTNWAITISPFPYRAFLDEVITYHENYRSTMTIPDKVLTPFDACNVTARGDRGNTTFVKVIHVVIILRHSTDKSNI